MNDSISSRRRFLMNAAIGVAGVSLAGLSSAASTAGPAGTSSSGVLATMGPAKQVSTDVLDIGYVELGPESGRPIILLHGWPYDIYSFVDVAPLLASAGYRVIIPYLRGYGTTRFLSSEAARNGQPSALAVDVIALMDALKIEKAILAGFDWGARTANIIAALWPERGVSSSRKRVLPWPRRCGTITR